MLRVYSKLQTIRRKTAATLVRDNVLRPSDYALPTSYPLNCIVFGNMAADFTRGLIGEVNRFFVHLHYADCWIRVAVDCEEKEKSTLLWEFAEPMLELSVGRPYSVKSHFVFAVVHLLNQWNSHKIPHWKDELPIDRRIDYKYLDTNKGTLGAGREQFKDFVDKLDQLNNKAFSAKTQEFRNRLQHQFRLHFDIGLTTYFERQKTDGGVTYTYMVSPPLRL